MLFFFNIYYVYSMILVDEYKVKIKDENAYKEKLFKKVLENLKLRRIEMYESVTDMYNVIKNLYVYDVNDVIKKELFRRLFDLYNNLLHLILKSKLDKHLVKFILNVKINRKTNITYYLLSSVYETELIQNILIASCSDKEKKEILPYWYRDIYDRYSINIWEMFYCKTVVDGECIREENFFHNKILPTIMLQFLMSINEKFEEFKRMNPTYIKGHEKDKLFYFYKSDFYMAINKTIDSLKKSDVSEFYLYLDPSGLKNNKIGSSILDLYNEKKNQVFKEYEYDYNFGQTELDYDDNDFSYLEGKVFELHTKELFNYVMGLLQYVACKNKKHISIKLKKSSYFLEIIGISNAMVKSYLYYYKRKSDITEEIKNNFTRYLSSYFVTILDKKKYRFTKQKNDIAVQSECLMLECSHILGQELLTENLNISPKECLVCNKNFDKVSYFNIVLFTEDNNKGN